MIDGTTNSIRKCISDYMLARLSGDADEPMPDILGEVALNKNRRVPIDGSEMPMYSVYFLNDAPTGVGGDPRRPVRISRKLLLEVRIILPGTDDAADPHCQWVTLRTVSADRCIVDGTQLALGVVEGETLFEPLDGAQSEVTVTKIRFIVDYTTNPTDITRVS